MFLHRDTLRANLFTPVIFLILLLVVSTVLAAETATVSGRMLMKNGSPLSGGFVVVFDLQSGVPPAPERYFLPPDYHEKINNDGSFRMLLPAGEYAIGAVKLREGKAGPPGEGDIYFIIKDEDLELKRIVVPENGHIDLGNVAAGEIFRPVPDPSKPVTSVSGRIIDTRGNPVKGVVATAVLIRKGMKDLLFFSPETDSSGIYNLSLPFGGTYNVGTWGKASADSASTNSIRIDTGGTLRGIDLQLQ